MHMQFEVNFPEKKFSNFNQFLPHDAMQARPIYAIMRCVSVCLSVCVSATFVHSVKTNKDIFEIFSPSGSYHSSFFDTKRDGDIPTGTPPPDRGRRMQVG